MWSCKAGKGKGKGKGRQITVVMCLWLMILAITACGGNGGKKAKGKAYTWDDVSFTVKSIGYSSETEGSEKEDSTGKRVSVIIDFGQNEVPQSSFESHVAKGKLTLAGRKPDNYNYHMVRAEKSA